MRGGGRHRRGARINKGGSDDDRAVQYGKYRLAVIVSVAGENS